MGDPAAAATGGLISGRIRRPRGSATGDQLAPLDRVNLRTQALAALRGGIVSGSIVPGQPYTVRSFAEQLHVSDTPVREALFDLASKGMIEAVTNRGFIVPVLSEHDLDELFELRILLELPATTRVATERRLDGVNTVDLRRMCATIEHRARTKDLVGFLWADRGFHLALLMSLGNARLVQVVSDLRDQARLTGLRRLAAEGKLDVTAGEHAQLLEAIVAGDGGSTRELMHRHLQHTRGIWAGMQESSD